MRSYKLTRVQKEILSQNGMDAKDWLLVEETEFYLKVIHKANGSRKSVNKFPARPIRR